MSGIASAGAAAKRQRQQLEEDEAAEPAALEIAPDSARALLFAQQQVHITNISPSFAHATPYTHPIPPLSLRRVLLKRSDCSLQEITQLQQRNCS